MTDSPPKQTCKRCEEPLPANYSPRKCAFKNGFFSSDNWNCGTANALRDIAIIHGAATRYSDESIGYVPAPDNCECGSAFIVLTWYKCRGRVDDIFTSYHKEPLKLKDAEAIIAAFADDLAAAENDKEPQWKYGGNYP